MSEDMKEIVNFLKPETRLDLKTVSILHILGLTARKDGRDLIISSPDIIRSLIVLCEDSSEVVSKDACLSLVNISAEETAIPVLLDASNDAKDVKKSKLEIVSVLLNIIVNPDSSSADPACMILSNMSRPLTYCEQVLERIGKSAITFEKLIAVFSDVKYNKKGACLDYLAPFFSNLSQLSQFRKILLDRCRFDLLKLLPFTTYKRSLIRRGGVVGTLRNCCFDVEDHEWLLGDQVDILPHLLLPLAGPEEFDEEENEKLPIDLQYLPEDK